MEHSLIDVKPVSVLADFKFFIPAYQRGYRWTDQQVEDLLNDISDFSPESGKGTNIKSWYCLQPLVIKVKENGLAQGAEADNSKTWYEVIDGQQRLTTIFLIGHYINEMWRGKGKDSEVLLNYETRQESAYFLQGLTTDHIEENTEENYSNIDFYHIAKAYKAIHNWVNSSKNKRFAKDSFIDKFLNHTRVIWYETREKDPINIFTRLNMGKIPLTNAELIKALFLNSSQFQQEPSEKIRLKQLEIAGEWDRMELALQNQKFWYFINETDNDIPTRIEFIFDLMADKPEDAHDYYTFQYFSQKFQNNSETEIKSNWNDIKQYYSTLEQWYHDRELYHKIGFLVSVGVNIKELIKESQDLTKTAFKEFLHTQIAGQVTTDLDDLDYKNRSQVRKVLLLHNIQTMLENSLETSLFPFDLFKTEKWDVEHIHAVQEDIPVKEKHRKDWLDEALRFIKDEELKAKAISYQNQNFEQLFAEILNYFSETKKHEEINDISNLALLDARTNRGYGNAVFPVKRKKIIEKDIAGTFIPVCTRNVFMKYYNQEVEQMTFWGDKDRSSYFESINNVLSTYSQANHEQ